MQPGQSGSAALLPARRVIATAWDLLLSRPKQVLLPVAVVEVPASAAAAAIIALALTTVLRDTPLDTAEGGYLALLLATGAAQALFAQVAHGAAIVSIAGLLRGAPPSLSEALDPPFTRMGGLLALLVIVLAVTAGLAITIVGLLVLPYIAIRLALVYQAFLLEERPVLGALGRSWAMMRGQMLRMLGVMLLTLLIFLGPAVLIQSLDALEMESRSAQVSVQAIVSVAQGILAVPLVAFTSATTTVFYLNLRDVEHG